MQTRIDHLVIGSATLVRGVDYVKDRLGVEMPFGGIHEKMGTHNHLMQLGKNVFLEIIAINDEIDPPKRPRWFGLDDQKIRRQVEMQPALLTWVVNTDNLNALQQKAQFSVGIIEKISRGDLNWYFGLPRDGRLLAGGMLPYAIEWRTEEHPCANMADLGCRFHSLEIYHPYAPWLQTALDSIGAAKLVKICPLPSNETPYLKAYIHTPRGLRELSSREP
jgi:hypothetical protein